MSLLAIYVAYQIGLVLACAAVVANASVRTHDSYGKVTTGRTDPIFRR